jgi:hypothetical protein
LTASVCKSWIWKVRLVPAKASSRVISTGCSRSWPLRAAAHAGAAGGAGRAAEELLEQAAHVLALEVEGGAAAVAAAPGVGARAGAAAAAADVGAGGLGLLDPLPVVAPAVVLLALVGVGQHAVRLANLLEEGLGLLVARVDVRVVLAGQLAVGRLDVLDGL